MPAKTKAASSDKPNRPEARAPQVRLPDAEGFLERHALAGEKRQAALEDRLAEMDRRATPKKGGKP